MVRGQQREGSGIRVALGLVGLVAILVLAAAPLFSPVERVAPARRRGAHDF
jgi:hypothetical protein